MNTLYVRLPPLAQLQAHDWATPVPFAQASLRQVQGRGPMTLTIGEAALADLPKARATIWLLSGSDVSLYSYPLPKLSAKKLQQALPHILEEFLIEDAGLYSATFRSNKKGEYWLAAVAQNTAWQQFERVLAARGGIQEALPQTLCLPLHSAFFAPRPDGLIEVCARRSAAQGIGLTVPVDNLATAVDLIFAAPLEAPISAPVNAGEVVDVTTVSAGAELIPIAPTRYDSPSWTALGESVEVPSYIPAATSYQRYDWGHWIHAAEKCPLNLLRFYQPGQSGFATSAAANTQGNAFSQGLKTILRWTIGLVGLSVLAFNVEAWRMGRQADDLRAQQQEIFRAAYPNDILPNLPLDSLRAKIAAHKSTTPTVKAAAFTLLQQFEQAIAPLNADGKKVARVDFQASPEGDHLEVQWQTLAGKDIEQMQKQLAAAGFKVSLGMDAKKAKSIWTLRP